LLPVTILFSIYLLVRGHNEPGGGFSAGIVTGLALVIQALAFGAARTRARLLRLLRPAFWIGLVVALAAGAIPMAAGEPFLTHHHVGVPIAGTAIPLSTTLLFDLGVYATVVGAVAAMLDGLAEPGVDATTDGGAS
jgi:multisubunit Na+/H+ antiporter MnhB subunit